MRKQNIVKRITESTSFAESKEDILLLAAQAGIRDTISEIFATAKTEYEIGMAVAKVFDTFAIVPTMNWLPPEIKKLYNS